MRRLAGLLGIVWAVAFLLEGATRESTRTPEIVPAILSPAEQNLAIVVNLSNPLANLTRQELHSIFLGERNYWPNGRKITLVLREAGEAERKTVLRDICRMNEEEYKNHILHGLYTGEILVSPKILATPAGVRKFVFNVPGAIGYLRASDVDATVKVVRVDELLPEDQGYKLHVEPISAK